MTKYYEKKAILNWKLWATYSFNTASGFSPLLKKLFNWTCQSDRKNKIATIDNFDLKYDCSGGCIVNGTRRLFWIVLH